MDSLRKLAPWQIIAISVVVLLVFLVAAYLAVTRLTTSNVKPSAEPQAPGNLGGQPTQNTLKKLEAFEAPRNLPIVTQPLRTPDPNNPSTVNPFQ